MAADQRTKRLNSASMINHDSPEPHKTKRKNLDLVQSDLTMKSHVCVQWDGNHQKVVAKPEQIGISWRQMKPFASFAHDGHNILADVLAIPEEIFSLDSLSEVLSYEVWNTHLLDSERNLLMQFLPRDLKPHQVVGELLSGDNFHFGNPFVKWGSLLCSGSLHPDMIVNQEQHLKSDKRAYYSQIHNYHKDMIGFLVKLKRSWESCKDPEKEILQKIRRSKNDVEKRTRSNLNEFNVDDHDANVTATSESCSWDAEEKEHSGNQISSIGQRDEHQKRVLDKGSKGKPRNLMVSSDTPYVGEKPKKGDKIHKLNEYSSDGDKYMSYIKISKKQHELVKSMKLSCKSIQSHALNHILGDLVLDNIHAQPYEVFIKEEQQKLHDHWLRLVKKDLPAAYANWAERLIQKHAVKNSLVVEMKDKSNPLAEDDDIVSSGQPHDQEDGSLDKQSLEDVEGSIAQSPENQSLHYFYHSNGKLNDLCIDSNKIILSKRDDASQSITEYAKIENSHDDPISEGAPFSSDGHAWQAPEMPHSYYDSSVSHDYTVNGLSLVNPQVNEELQTQVISLDSNLHLEDPDKEFLHRQSDDGPFNSCQSQDQIDFIQSLIKGKGVNSYHPEQKCAGSSFQTSSNVMMGDDKLSSHFKEPLQTSLTLDQGNRKASEVYMPESMSDNIYSERGRYLIPRQDALSLSRGSITNWAAKSTGMAAPPRPHVNTGDFIGHNWFSSDHQVRLGWNGSNNVGLSSHSLGAGSGGNSDQSLFSVLSHCSQLSSGSPYESVRRPDQFLAPGAYGMLDAGTPRINAVVPPSSHPLDYFSGRDAPSAVVPNDMTWVSLPPPSPDPALNDQMGKPYLRSWNQ